MNLQEFQNWLLSVGKDPQHWAQGGWVWDAAAANLQIVLDESNFPLLPEYCHLPEYLNLQSVSFEGNLVKADLVLGDEGTIPFVLQQELGPQGTFDNGVFKLNINPYEWPARPSIILYFNFSFDSQPLDVHVAGLFACHLPVEATEPQLSFRPTRLDHLECPADPQPEIVSGAIPLGWVSPPSSHVFPTPHHGFCLNAQALSAVVPHTPVYAVADGVIWRVHHRVLDATGGNGPYTPYHDIALEVAATTTYGLRYGHLHALNMSSVFKLIPAPYSDWLATPPGDLDFPHDKEYSVNIKVLSGQVLGWAGGYGALGVEYFPQLGFDLGGYNLLAPLPFVNADYFAENDARMLHCDSPLNYYPAPPDQLHCKKDVPILWRLFVPGYPPVGQVCYDQPGTLAGAWFGAAPKPGAEPIEDQLAFVYDVYDPQQAIVSIGDKDLRLLPDSVGSLPQWGDGDGKWPATNPNTPQQENVEYGVYRVIDSSVGPNGFFDVELASLEGGEPLLLEIKAERTGPPSNPLIETRTGVLAVWVLQATPLKIAIQLYRGKSLADGFPTDAWNSEEDVAPDCKITLGFREFVR